MLVISYVATVLMVVYDFCIHRLRCEEASPRNKWVFYTRLKQIGLLAQLANKIADAGRILDGAPLSSESTQIADSAAVTAAAAAASGDASPSSNAAAQEILASGSISKTEKSSEIVNGSKNCGDINSICTSNSRSDMVALAQAESAAELLSSCWEFMLEEDLFAADVLLRPAAKALVDALTYASSSHSQSIYSSSNSSTSISSSGETSGESPPTSDIEARAAAVGCAPRAAAIACLHALVVRAGAYEEGDVIAVTAGTSRGGPRSDSDGGGGGSSGSFDSNFTLASSDEEDDGCDGVGSDAAGSGLEGGEEALSLEVSDPDSPDTNVSPRRSVASDEVGGSSSASLSPNPQPPLAAATLEAIDGSSDKREDSLQPDEEKDDTASTAAERSGDVDESVLDEVEHEESDPTLNMARFKKLSGVLEAVKLNKWVTLMDLRRRSVAAALHLALKARFLLEKRLQACLDVPPRTVAVAVAVDLAQPLGLGLTPGAEIGHLQPNSPFAERVPAADAPPAAVLAKAAAASVDTKLAVGAGPAAEVLSGGRGGNSDRGGRSGRGRGGGGRGRGRGGRGGCGNGSSGIGAAVASEVGGAQSEAMRHEAFERVELHSIVPGSRVIAVGATAAASSSADSPPPLPLPPPPLQPSPSDDSGVVVWSQDALKARIAVAKAVSFQSESGQFMPVTSLQSLSEALQVLRDQGQAAATVLVEVPAAGIGCENNSCSNSSSGDLAGASLADRCALVALLAEMIVVQPQHLDFFHLKSSGAEDENGNDAAEKEAGEDSASKSNADGNDAAVSSTGTSRRDGGLWPALVRLFFAFPRSDMLNNGFFKCCEAAVKENHRTSLKSLLLDERAHFLGRVLAPLTASFGTSAADAGPPLRFNVPSTVVIAEQAHLLERSDDICLDSDGDSGEEDENDNNSEGEPNEGEGAKAADGDENGEGAASEGCKGSDHHDGDVSENQDDTALLETDLPTTATAAASSPGNTEESERTETTGLSTTSADREPRLLPKLAPSLARAQAVRFAELLRDACAPLPKSALLPTALRRNALWQSEVLPALAALEEQWAEKGLGLHVATAMAVMDSSEEEQDDEEEEEVMALDEDDDITGTEVMAVEGGVVDEAAGAEPEVVMVEEEEVEEEEEDEESPWVVLAAPSSASAQPLHLANEFVAIVPPAGGSGASSGSSSSLAARIWALQHSSRFCGRVIRWRHGPVVKAQRKEAMARRKAAAAAAASSSLVPNRMNGKAQSTISITPIPGASVESVQDTVSSPGGASKMSSEASTPTTFASSTAVPALASASPRTKATNAVAQAVAAAADRASSLSTASTSGSQAEGSEDEDDRRVIHLGDSPPRPENGAQDSSKKSYVSNGGAATAAATAPNTPPDLRTVRRASEIRPDDAEAAAAAVKASGRWRAVGLLPRPRRATSVKKEGRKTPCPIKPPKKVPTLRPVPSSIS